MAGLSREHHAQAIEELSEESPGASREFAVNLFAMKHPLEDDGIGFKDHSHAVAAEARLEEAGVTGHPFSLARL